METCFLSKEVQLKNVNESGLQVHCTPALDSALPSFPSLGVGDGALLEGVGDVGLPGVSKRAVGQRLPSRHRVSVGLHRGNTGGGTGSEAGGGRGSRTRGHLRWVKVVSSLLVPCSVQPLPQKSSARGGKQRSGNYSPARSIRKANTVYA